MFFAARCVHGVVPPHVVQLCRSNRLLCNSVWTTLIVCPQAHLHPRQAKALRQVQLQLLHQNPMTAIRLDIMQAMTKREKMEPLRTTLER